MAREDAISASLAETLKTMQQTMSECLRSSQMWKKMLIRYKQSRYLLVKMLVLYNLMLVL